MSLNVFFNSIIFIALKFIVFFSIICCTFYCNFMSCTMLHSVVLSHLLLRLIVCFVLISVLQFTLSCSESRSRSQYNDVIEWYFIGYINHQFLSVAFLLNWFNFILFHCHVGAMLAAEQGESAIPSEWITDVLLYSQVSSMASRFWLLLGFDLFSSVYLYSSLPPILLMKIISHSITLHQINF